MLQVQQLHRKPISALLSFLSRSEFLTVTNLEMISNQRQGEHKVVKEDDGLTRRTKGVKGSSDEVRTAKFDQETRVPLSDGRRASEWEGSRVRLREIILSTDRGHRSCGILHIHALRI